MKTYCIGLFEMMEAMNSKSMACAREINWKCKWHDRLYKKLTERDVFSLDLKVHISMDHLLHWKSTDTEFCFKALERYRLRAVLRTQVSGWRTPRHSFESLILTFGLDAQVLFSVSRYQSLGLGLEQLSPDKSDNIIDSVSCGNWLCKEKHQIINKYI